MPYAPRPDGTASRKGIEVASDTVEPFDNAGDRNRSYL